MNNIVIIAYAYIKNMETGENIQSRNRQFITYMKNVVVACLSAKHYNPEDEIAFFTNVEQSDIPTEYKQILADFEIKIYTVDFDRFVFSKDTPWGLCFYKLCALSHALELDYNNYCLLDSDVVVQDSFNFIWEEGKEYLLMYDISHGLQVLDYHRFCNETINFPEVSKYITQYGGEFLCSNKKNLKVFMSEAQKIYEKIVEENIKFSTGDELISSIAAHNVKSTIHIKNASPYVNRFWTGGKFRLINTNYENNRVAILHLPDEKERGIVKLYNKYYKRGKLPSRVRVWSICRLSRYPVIDRLKHLYVSIRNIKE